MRKTVNIELDESGACTLNSEGVTTIMELIGILEMTKAMQINGALGLRPNMAPPADSGIVVPRVPGIVKLKN